ncbi:TPA: hypothetical protein QIC06_004233 [Enterobacter kobei]|nr:hypothetical protein [Enterobacter kobei]
MPIYTDDPGSGINQPLSNVESGLGESLSASFAQGFREGHLMSGIRFAQADQYTNDPNSPVISKTEADAKLKELGVKSINIPESGVTQAFMDHVTQERKEALARNQIAAAAPSGFINTPLNFMAGLAGSMADPANLAIGLIPFAGEAKAATALGRFGERFIQGAGYGGAQTAVALPFTAMAAAADGEDYSLGNAMENIFMGMVGGGLIHAGGGVIADMVRGARKPTPSPVEEPTIETSPLPESPTRTTVNIEEDNPSSVLSRQIDQYADDYSYNRAYDEVITSRREELQSIQEGFSKNVSDLKSEISANNHSASLLDESLGDRTKSYQQQRMSFKQAKSQAMKDIQREKESISFRNDELQSAIERNAAAERARSEEASISRGELSDEIKSRIESRAQEVRSAFNVTNPSQWVRTASQRIDSANWTQRENAFRAGISHMLQGRTPDIEPFFDLHRTDLRATAFDQIKQGPRPDIDEPTVRSSADADMQYQRAQKNDDLVNAQEDFDSELQLARNMVDDLDSPELKSALESIQKEANDESFIKGIQAYATCMLRRI